MFRATFRRLLAIDDPPERTALAFSIGVFIAFSPFLGLHTIMATAVAFIVSSTPAYAAPVYLDCYLDTKEGRQYWSISLNEERGTIAWDHKIFELPAQDDAGLDRKTNIQDTVVIFVTLRPDWGSPFCVDNQGINFLDW